MDDLATLQKAKTVFENLCTALDNKGLKFQRNDDELSIYLIMNGDDIPMHINMRVDADRQLISVISIFPFDICEDKRVDATLAVCYVNDRLADGSFDYNIKDGTLLFRMTASFRDSLIGEEAFIYMLACSSTTIDAFNDKFLMLDKGMITLEQFIEND